METCKNCKWFDYLHKLHPESYHEQTEWGNCQNEEVINFGEADGKIELGYIDDIPAFSEQFGCIFHSKYKSEAKENDGGTEKKAETASKRKPGRPKRDES
jgi:hypothetical protein